MTRCIRWAVLTAVALFVMPAVSQAVVTLEMTSDRVYLANGRIIECTVILRGKESVTVVAGEEEKTFRMSDVVRIEKGVSSEGQRTFETGPSEGHEVINAPEDEAEVVAPVAPPAPPAQKPRLQKPSAPQAARQQPRRLQPANARPRKPAATQTAPGTAPELQGAPAPPARPAQKKPRNKQKVEAEDLIDILEQVKQRIRDRDR